MPSLPNSLMMSVVLSSNICTALAPVSNCPDLNAEYSLKELRVSLFKGRSINLILPLPFPISDQSAISPRKILANCSIVKLSEKRLFIPTMMAIFSRRTNTCFNPCAFSSGVSLRPRDARSTLPSKTDFIAYSFPFTPIST